MSESRTSVDMNQMAETYAGVYFVKLLFEEEVCIDTALLFEKMKACFGNVDKVMDEQGMHVYALLDHMLTYAQGERVPSQLSVMELIPFSTEPLQNDLIMTQCWGLEDPQALLERCHYEIMIHDLMAAGLDREERTQLLATFVDAMLELFPACIALYWPHAQKFQSTMQYTQTGWNDPKLHFLDGGLQIRFFNIQNSGDMLIDSVGLTAIGLPDIQCHYHDLDPNPVVNFVANTASYLFQAGDVIADGETIEGFIGDDHKWVCQHEDSLLLPKRVVLDVNMKEYAAGGR